MKLPLIEEFRLVVPAEAGHPELALRVIWQHSAPEYFNRGIENAIVVAKSEAVEHISGVGRHGSRHPTGGYAEFQCSQDLVLIQVLQCYGRGQILPALLRVGSLQQKALVCLLRHYRRGRPDAFIGSPVECEWTSFIGGGSPG
jgi:hypothetical protein